MNENQTEIYKKAPAVLKLSDLANGLSLEVLKSYMQAREQLGFEFDSVAQQLIDEMQKVGLAYIHASGEKITFQVLLDLMDSDSIRKNLDSAEPIDLDKLFALEEPLDDKNT